MDILIIEDDPTVQQILSKALGRAGFMVKCVDNGLQALAELQSTEFRAIVCDVGLPFLEGKSLYDHLESDHPAAAKRVIFVTGMANDPKTKKLLQDTGRPVVSKPFDVADLVKQVRAVADHGH